MLKWISPWHVAGFLDPQAYIYSDVVGEHYPWKLLFSEYIARGEFPLWNPYNFSGTPFVALSTPQLFDITNVIFLIFPARVAFDISMVLKVWMAGLFMLLLSKHFNFTYWSSILSAVAYMLNGAFIMNLPFGWMTGGWIWLPLVVMFLEISIDKGKIEWALLAGVFLGFSHLGAHLQVSVQILVCLLLWFLYHSISLVRRKEFSKLLRLSSLFSICSLVSVAVAAIQLIPTFELLSASEGVSRSYQAIEWFNDLPRNLVKIPFALSFLTPNFFGHHSTFSPVLITGEKWTSYLMGYVGFIPLVLAVIAMIFVKQNGAKLFRFIALGTLVTVFLTPLVVPLYFRTLVIWCFATAVLAGFGLDYVLQKASTRFLTRLRRITVSALVILSIGLITVQVGISILGDRYIPRIEKHVDSTMFADNSTFAFARQFYINKVATTFRYYSVLNPKLLVTLAVVGGFAALLGLFNKKKLSIEKAGAALFLLTVVDLVYFFFLYVPVVDLRKNPLYPVTGSIAYLHSDTSLFRVATYSRPGLDPPIFYEESNIPVGLQVTHHTGSINYGRSVVFVREFSNFMPTSFPKLADLGNVKYFLTKSITFDTTKYPVVYQGEINIYRNPRVLPRAFTVSHFRVFSSPDSILRAMKSPQFSPANEVLLEERPRGSVLDSALNISKIDVVKYKQQYVKLQTLTDGNSLLVFSDTQYPGWKAFIDGVETRIYAADYIFRAICLPEGSHVIEFRFEPLSFRIGMWTSFSTLFLCLTCISVSLRLRKAPSY
jgi:hypothetical protein